MAGLGHPVSEQPEPDEIRRELAVILASVVFRGSKRCHDFLAFVVAKALAGDVDNLKERTLAVEVFGRKADADLGEDSIVRVGAREVRKRLTQYYVTEGADDAVRIEILAGSYAPAFHRHSAGQKQVESPATVVEPAPVLPEPPETPAPTRYSPRPWFWIAAAVLLIVVPVLVWRLLHRAPEPFETFWQPAFARQGPIILAMAHPIVYHPSSRANLLDDQRNGKPPMPLQRAIHLPPETLTGADYVPVFDQYVGFGDSVVAARLSVLFAQHGREAHMRLASKLDFTELRDSSAVLIGAAYTNRWTMELSQKLRFRFDFCDSDKPCIVDSNGGKQWTLSGKSDNGRSTEDYILGCRLLRAETGGFVVIGAGLTQVGTEEAGRILSDPDAMVPLLRKLPAAWRTQNLEFILHSEVLGDAPTAPELIAAHVW